MLSARFTIPTCAYSAQHEHPARCIPCTTSFGATTAQRYTVTTPHQNIQQRAVTQDIPPSLKLTATYKRVIA